MRFTEASDQIHSLFMLPFVFQGVTYGYVRAETEGLHTQELFFKMQFFFLLSTLTVTGFLSC